MTAFDCGRDMASFHQGDVTLGATQQSDMRGRRDAGRTRLYTGLDRNGHKAPKMIHSQGSYAMHTMVQDDDCDYDIDDGVYFRPEDLEDANGNRLAPLQARQRMCDALSQDQRFEKAAEVHRNCVRQEYQAGYHIDMPVYRISIENKGTDQEKEFYELASGDAWERSDARSVTRWFKDTVAGLKGNDGEDGRQMRRLVRLTKAFARSRTDWKDETCSGIVLTRLVVDEFAPATDRDDQALVDTWKRIEARLELSKVVEHPVNAKRLAESGDTKVGFFLSKLCDALKSLEVLQEDDCTRSEARAAWDSVFNTEFFGDRPEPNGDGGKRSFFVATESKTDTRNDGNGRFG